MSEVVDDDLNAIKAKGNDYFVKGDYCNAEQTYTHALEKFDCNNVLLLTNRSAARLGLDNYIGAFEDAEKAISLDPKWTKAYFRKATALEKLNRPKEAYETWIAASAYCEPSAWLSKQLQQATTAWKKIIRTVKIESGDDLVSRYRLLTDPREKLSTLAHFWNDSTLSERLGHFHFLITLIGGEGDISSYNKSITEDFMVPMPLNNYEDLPRSAIALWCDYFQSLPASLKIDLLEKLWHSLTDKEQTLVITDLRVFISQAIMGANDLMIAKARGLIPPDQELNTTASGGRDVVAATPIATEVEDSKDVNATVVSHPPGSES